MVVPVLLARTATLLPRLLSTGTIMKASELVGKAGASVVKYASPIVKWFVPGAAVGAGLSAAAGVQDGAAKATGGLMNLAIIAGVGYFLLSDKKTSMGITL